jgi:hypothetical protein
MPKIYYLFVILIVFCSCKDDKLTIDETDQTEESIATNTFPRKLALNAKSKEVVKDWLSFKAFDLNFDRIYKATYREDLVLIVEDLVENQKKMETSVYPTKFNIPQIKGRQKVLKTYILKAKGDLEYRQDPKVSIEEMIAAYNNFRNQFNVEVNNTLSEDFLSDEKK